MKSVSSAKIIKLLIVTMLVGLVFYLVGSLTLANLLASRPFTFKGIEVGETRKSALAKVNDALMHHECRNPNDSVDDVFFYDTTDPEKAHAISIQSEAINGEFRVVRMLEIEDYLIIPFYHQCLGIQWPQATVAP